MLLPAPPSAGDSCFDCEVLSAISEHLFMVWLGRPRQCAPTTLYSWGHSGVTPTCASASHACGAHLILIRREAKSIGLR